jgi:glutathione synthase/RimK-type ligase-like ATP-grasp enzyme
MKVTILKNEDPDSSKKWEISCRKANIDFDVIDLTSWNWYELIKHSNSDIFLLKPPGETYKFKQLYDERLYVVSTVMHKFVFPSFKEVYIYENKRMLSAFLKGGDIPMPETHVFYNRDEALNFADSAKMPIVGKTGIGASGTGVRIIRSKSELKAYIGSAFGKGIKRRLGPNRNTGNIKSWSKKAYASPEFFLKKIKKYLEIYKDAQKGFVILQEYTPHEFEWRIVKIGDSWFGHQKVKRGDKASGTKGIDYVAPPFALLDFCRKICEAHQFYTMAIDIFEHPEKGYVVNELQTIFGHVQDYIMEVEGKIGRYIYKNDTWVFEEGDFNTNESYDLRLETAIKLYNETNPGTGT